MWDQLYTFWSKTVEDESLEWWSEDGAWPSVIDDFVAFVREEKRGGWNGGKDVNADGEREGMDVE